MKTSLTCCFLILVVASGCNPQIVLETSDGFESNKLRDIWRSDKFLPGALEIQSDIVKTGESAVKITLNPGDQIDEEKGTNLERAEIMEARKYMSVEDSVYLYEFSLFLPNDFPLVPTRLVIAQWKQNCKSGNCNPDNPVIALRYVSGELNITLQTSPEKIVLYSRADEIRNQWLNFRFKIRFSRQHLGLIFATLNNQKIIDYSGITAYIENYGYPFPGQFYFKTGLYRDNMDQSMTIYIDDYKKSRLSR